MDSPSTISPALSGSCRAASALSLSPAFSPEAAFGQEPAGVTSWINANAGAAIETIMSAATKAAANTILARLNNVGTSLLFFPSLTRTTCST
jgi:hypothetical protein